MSMCFHKPDFPPKIHKSHSPKEKNIALDVNGSIKVVRQCPKEETINWPRVARRFGATEIERGSSKTWD